MTFYHVFIYLGLGLHFVPGLQSAVCILYVACILDPVCSLQSAVCSLRFVLTKSIIIYFYIKLCLLPCIILNYALLLHFKMSDNQCCFSFFKIRCLYLKRYKHLILHEVQRNLLKTPLTKQRTR